MKRMLYIILALILAFGGVAGLMLAYPQPAAAATTLTVTTNSDAGDDATIGADLAADTADGAGLSLREALNWAVAGDNVTFDGGLSGQTVTLSGTQLTIDKDITLDGDLDNNGTPDIAISGNNTSRVIYTTGLTAAARLEGFTITSGGNTNRGGGMYNSSSSPTIINCTFNGNAVTHIEDARGGGMYNTNSSPTITGCTFSGNSVSADWNEYGGGMYNTNSSPAITGCTFNGNTASAGGGMYNASSSPAITGCTFNGNTADQGGGMLNSYSSPTVTSCTFNGNTASEGGGMHNINNSSPAITSCTFSGNTAGYGGGMHNINNSSPTVTGCTFTGNTADTGGGMRNYSSSPTITGCTFSGNSVSADWNEHGGGMTNYNSSPAITGCTFSGNIAWAGGGMYNINNSSPTITNCTFAGNTANTGGGMYNSSSSPTIINCILWGDAGVEIAGAAVVNYSDVQGGYGGTGNINQDPLFFNAAGGDFHLLPASPCIDAGSNAAVPVGITEDFDGEPRIMGAAVDMGVDEYLQTPEAWVDDDWTGKTFKEQVDGHTFGIDAFATIQDGIDAVISGNTVNVAAGTYSEHVTICKGLTLQSVSGSIIDGGGSGTAATVNASGVVITGFTIRNAETGISVTSGAGNVIQYCNIINNTTRGVNNTSGNLVTAENNWWGNASGPVPPGTYQSYGDNVSEDVDFEPWLLEEVVPGVEPTTCDRTLALKDGWTLTSTDALVEENRAWQGKILAYKYTSAGFVDATLADLEPLTAIYVKTDGGGGVGFDYAEVAPAVYARDLEVGWNLISIPITVADTGAILSPLRYVTIGTQQGIGLSTLVSQGDYNQFSDSFYLATLTDTDWGALLPLYPFDGYWAYMNAAKTFEVIPD